MKAEVSKILLVGLVLVSWSRATVGGTAEQTANPLFLAVVIDSTPTSGQTWRQLKHSACQAVDNLRPGDRVEILRARTGKPALHSDSIIQSPSVSGRQNLRQSIDDIPQVFFLSKADVDRAVAVAFEHLDRSAASYHCGVLVFSSGYISHAQVQQLRRLAAAYKFRKWSFGIVIPQGAHRGLLEAASQGELDVIFLDRASLSLAHWLEQARSRNADHIGEAPQSFDLNPPPEGRPVEPEQSAAPAQPKVAPPAFPAPERARGRTEPNDVGPRYLLPVYPVPPDQLPVTRVPDVKPILSPEESDAETETPSWFRRALAYEYTPAIAFAGLVVGLILLVVLATTAGGSPDGLGDLDEYGGDDSPQKLLCSVADQEYDLGEEEGIGTLIIGKGPASAVPLPDDGELEDEHVEITRRRNGWQIKNLAEQPIVIDGSPLKKKGTIDLLFPATIELTPPTRITLSRAPMLAPEPTIPATGEEHESDDF